MIFTFHRKISGHLARNAVFSKFEFRIMEFATTLKYYKNKGLQKIELHRENRNSSLQRNERWHCLWDDLIFDK